MRVNFCLNQCSVHFVSKWAGPCYQITEVEVRFPTDRFLAKFKVMILPIGRIDLDDNEWPLFGEFTRLSLRSIYLCNSTTTFVSLQRAKQYLVF